MLSTILTLNGNLLPTLYSIMGLHIFSESETLWKKCLLLYQKNKQPLERYKYWYNRIIICNLSGSVLN